MRLPGKLALAMIVLPLVSFLAGCGENATTPATLDTATSQLGANPDAADIGNRTYVGPAKSRPDTWDVHMVPGTLLVTTNDGLVAIPPDGSWFILSTAVTGRFDVEVLGTRIFVSAASIYELDHDGNQINVITKPPEIPHLGPFTVLPDGGFAILSNSNDEIYFMDVAGTYITTVAMPDPSPTHLQNTRGIVQDNTLIVSETGTWKIMEVDLTTYETSIFKDLTDPADSSWLSDLDPEGPCYYLGRPRRVQTFVDGGPVSDLCDFGDEYNVTAIVAEDPYLYVNLNFAGKVYRVNMANGAMVLLAEGLAYPLDMELLPLVLEAEPAGH